jgi:hypothetical protein
MKISLQIMQAYMQIKQRIKTQITLDSDLDLELRLKATQERKSISDVVAEALRQYFSKPTK